VFDFVQYLLDASPFKKPYECGGWTPLLIHATIASNFLIFAVYAAIPILLIGFSSKRGELAFVVRRRLVLLFAAFIFFCGVTHLLRGFSFYWPAYRLQVVVNIITAAVSWVTVVVMGIVGVRQRDYSSIREWESLHEEVKALQQTISDLRRFAEEEAKKSVEPTDA